MSTIHVLLKIDLLVRVFKQKDFSQIAILIEIALSNKSED